MTAPQYLATLYALCGLSTLGIYVLHASAPRSLGGLYAYSVLAFAIATCWPPFFALWLLLPVLPYAKEKGT